MTSNERDLKILDLEAELAEIKSIDWNNWTSATSGYGIDPDDEGFDPNFCQTCDSCARPGNSDCIGCWAMQEDGSQVVFCLPCDDVTARLKVLYDEREHEKYQEAGPREV